MDFVDTFLNWEVIQRVAPMLVKGIYNTVALALTVVILGGFAGVGICLVRLYAPRPWRWFAIAFVDLFRAIPILVLLVLIYYALPFVGIRFNSFTAAALGLGLVFSSFTAEVFRAGIQAVPRGQTEAADSLGLPFRVTIWNPAASPENRDPAAHIQCRGHRQGHLVGLCGRHAGPAEAGHRCAGAHRQSVAADRRRLHVSDRAAAAGAARVDP